MFFVDATDARGALRLARGRTDQPRLAQASLDEQRLMTAKERGHRRTSASPLTATATRSRPPPSCPAPRGRGCGSAGRTCPRGRRASTKRPYLAPLLDARELV